jgi:hypothetical protein
MCRNSNSKQTSSGKKEITSRKEITSGNGGYNGSKKPAAYQSSVRINVVPATIGSTSQTLTSNAVQPAPATPAITTPAESKSPVATNDSAARLTVPDPADQTNKSIRKPVVHLSGNPWRFGFHAGAGISGIGTGLGFGTKENAADITGSPVPVPPSYTVSQPSEIKRGRWISLGLVAQKKISKRLYLGTGISYQQYSNKRTVGSYYTQDSITGIGNTVRQFYASSGSEPVNYTSTSHFVSIPVHLGWKVNRNWPLFVEAGLQVQQLIATNALIYDRVSMIYYKDKKSITATQFLGSAGLFYSLPLGGKTTLQLGPQFQYGFSSFSREDANKSLFSLGLQARFFLK